MILFVLLSFACGPLAPGKVSMERRADNKTVDEVTSKPPVKEVPPAEKEIPVLVSEPSPAPVEIEIIQKFLPNEAERKRLTVEYLKAHSEAHVLTGDLEADVRMKPRVIVLHWTGGPTAKSTIRTFTKATLRGRKSLQGAGALNVGSQYLVDRDGTIYQLLEDTRIVRHCIGLNHISIGIENVGGGKKWPLTKEQVNANIRLIRHLSSKHDITHLIGHMEYRGMEGHPYFSEKDPKYRTIKPDPGVEFLSDVRRGLVDLKLSGPVNAE